MAVKMSSPAALHKLGAGKSVDDKNYVSNNYPKTQGGMSFYAQLQDSKQSMYGGDNAIQIRCEQGGT